MWKWLKRLFWTALVIGSLALVALIIIGSLVGPQPSPMPSSKAKAEARQDELNEIRDKQLPFAIMYMKSLRSAMRNPDSFQLNRANFMDNGAMCFEYRAQNGFGGLNVGQAVLTPKGIFKTEEMAGFTHLWNRECANKSGYDQTVAIDAFLK